MKAQARCGCWLGETSSQRHNLEWCQRGDGGVGNTPSPAICSSTTALPISYCQCRPRHPLQQLQRRRPATSNDRRPQYLMDDKVGITSLGAVAAGDNRPGASITMQPV